MKQDLNQPNLIQLSWVEPYYISGALSHYLLNFKAESDKDWTTIPLPGTFTDYQILNFKPGTKYNTFIVPFDGNGKGIGSTQVSLTSASGWYIYNGSSPWCATLKIKSYLMLYPPPGFQLSRFCLLKLSLRKRYF